jgi:hypothetical protein
LRFSQQWLRRVLHFWTLTSTKQISSYLLHVCSLLGLFLQPEDGDDNFSPNTS